MVVELLATTTEVTMDTTKSQRRVLRAASAAQAAYLLTLRAA